MRKPVSTVRGRVAKFAVDGGCIIEDQNSTCLQKAACSKQDKPPFALLDGFQYFRCTRLTRYSACSLYYICSVPNIVVL